MHDTSPHALGPGAILLAEITSGSVVGQLGHALASIPPWLGGAVTALGVGMTLRIADPLLRDVGERLRARFSRRPPPAP